MSSCLMLRNTDATIMAADSALSSFDDGKFFRVGVNQKKIFSINGSLIFCSGKISLVDEAIDFMKKQEVLTAHSIYQHLKLKNISHNPNYFNLEILFSTLENGVVVVYQLSEYNDFEPKKIENPNSESISIHCAGIKTKECLSFAEKELSDSRDLMSIIPRIYKNLSCEQVGGYLDIWVISNEGIKKIAANINIDVPTSKLHSVVGEVIVGRILAGNTLTISNSGNNFVLDETGATLTNAKFSIQTTNTKIAIDPTSTISFRIQKNEGGTFADKFWVDNTGNVNFSGILTGATGVFSGTLSATVGNIGSLVIDSLGLKTSDGVNYLRGNGDFKWGALSITSSSAVFTGDIYANKLVGAVSYSQLTDIPADKITSGTMSGYRVYGGTASLSGINAVGSDLNIGGNLSVAGGAILSNGTVTTNNGYFYTNRGYIMNGYYGVTIGYSVQTPYGTRVLTFKGGILTGYT